MVGAAPVVVVVVGTQGFVGEQLPEPALSPLWALHCVAVTSVQWSNAPIGDDRTQHWICGCVVVVVEADTVVVVDGGGWQSHPMLGQPAGTGVCVQVLPAGH